MARMTVNNVAPTVTGLESSHDDLCDRASDRMVFISGSFADPGLDTHAVTANWGDGTVQEVSVNQAADTFSGSHTYVHGGLYPVTVTDSDAAVSDAAATSVVLTAAVTAVWISPFLS